MGREKLAEASACGLIMCCLGQAKLQNCHVLYNLFFSVRISANDGLASCWLSNIPSCILSVFLAFCL